MNQSPTTDPSSPITPHLTAIAFLGGEPAIDYAALGALFRALLRRRRAGQRTIGPPVARKRILTTLLLLVAGALLPATAARAAAMTVPSGLVHVSVDGQCSLREAIDNANDDDQTHADCPAGSGADVITLGAGTYQVGVARVGTGPLGANAFTITSEVTLIGAGMMLPGGTVLDAGNVIRHFYVDSPEGESASLHLQDLRVENGFYGGSGTSDFATGGGAIYNEGGDVSTLRVAFHGNEAESGGAIFHCAFLGLCEGGLVIEDTRFSQNAALQDGGAIYSEGELTVVDSALVGNEAGWTGGAIAIAPGGTTSTGEYHTTTVIDTFVMQNTANSAMLTGAAISNEVANLEVVASTIQDNVGTGITNHAGGHTVIRDTTVRNNTGSVAGGIANIQRHDALTVMEVAGSTVSGNTGEWAGGIANVAAADTWGNFSGPVLARLTVRNSTVSGNGAESSVGGIWSSTHAFHANDAGDDGIVSAQARLTLSNATVVGNQGPTGQVAATETHARNTIVAGSPSTNCKQLSSGGGFWASHDNLSDDASCPSGGFTQVSDVVLQPLADNGGPTRTHLPHPASPAVNAGFQDGCNLTLWDQRDTGFLRTVGSSCDIGAVEVGVLGALGIMTDDVTALTLRSGPAARNDGLRASLLAKIGTATEAVDRGDYGAATGQLGAFNEQVDAYAGGPIMEADALRLTTGALVITDLFPEGANPPDDSSPPEDGR